MVYTNPMKLIFRLLKYGLFILIGFIVLAIITGDKEPNTSEEVSTGATSTKTPGGEQGSEVPQVNTLGWNDSPYITRDGKELYFMYSRYNFYPIFSGGKPFLQGPDRPGHHTNDVNPFDDSDIYVAERNADGSWGTPQNLSFNDNRGGCCAMVVEGPPFTIYYQTHYEGMGTDIVYRVRNADGTWGKEINMGTNVNSPQTEDNPHASADQQGIWFTSNRPGGLGGNDIWFSQKVNGVWQPAVNVGAPISTGANEDQFWVSAMDNTVYFNREATIYETKWTGNGFTEPVALDLGRPFVAEASMPDSGNELFFGSPDTEKQKMKIFYARKNSNGSWGEPIPVD